MRYVVHLGTPPVSPVGITDDRERMRELTFFDAVRADHVSIVRSMLSREPGLTALRFRPAGDGGPRLDWPDGSNEALDWEAVAPDDLSGDAALHFAAAAGRVEMVETLLQFGADPLERRADGRSPIDLAEVCPARDAAAAIAELLRCALSTDVGSHKGAPGQIRRAARH